MKIFLGWLIGLFVAIGLVFLINLIWPFPNPDVAFIIGMLLGAVCSMGGILVAMELL